jgi:hypothetical protein
LPLSDDSENHSAPRHRKTAGALLLELLMIGIGVFLGASAEQWRDARHERELARASLMNFRREVSDNRRRIAVVRSYHTDLATNTATFLNGSRPHSLQNFITTVHYRGMVTADLEHTAWDLALATQALSNIDPSLAFDISHVYSMQQNFAQMQTNFLGNTLTPTTFSNVSNATPLAIAMSAYLGDVNIQEPLLMRLYDHLLPRIDSALGGPPPTPKKKDSVVAAK